MSMLYTYKVYSYDNGSLVSEWLSLDAIADNFPHHIFVEVKVGQEWFIADGDCTKFIVKKEQL